MGLMPLRTETLLSNQLGSVAVIVAFGLVPIAALIAFSIDFNIAGSNKSRVQVVLDAAAISDSVANGLEDEGLVDPVTAAYSSPLIWKYCPDSPPCKLVNCVL